MSDDSEKANKRWLDFNPAGKTLNDICDIANSIFAESGQPRILSITTSSRSRDISVVTLLLPRFLPESVGLQVAEALAEELAAMGRGIEMACNATAALKEVEERFKAPTADEPAAGKNPSN